MAIKEENVVAVNKLIICALISKLVRLRFYLIENWRKKKRRWSFFYSIWFL